VRHRWRKRRHQDCKQSQNAANLAVEKANHDRDEVADGLECCGELCSRFVEDFDGGMSYEGVGGEGYFFVQAHVHMMGGFRPFSEAQEGRLRWHATVS
jgi:hypothetical protein